MKELLRIIKGKYDVITRTYTVGSGQIAITMIKDTNNLLDEITKGDFVSERDFPFWAEMWSSAVALTDYIWENLNLQGEEVLELGCGLGMVGIVAAKKQAKVLMTDYNDDALMFARYNAMKNRCENIEFLNLNWQCPNLDNRKFKYILASDVVYEGKNWLPIINIFDVYLKPQGEAILSEPNRPNAVGFLELLRSKNFSYTKTLKKISWKGRVCPVSIYRIN